LTLLPALIKYKHLFIWRLVMLESFFMHYGNLAGFFILILGAMFYAFVKKSFGVALLLFGGTLLVFYYIF